MSSLPEESKETIAKLISVSSSEARKQMSQASDLQEVEDSLKAKLPRHCANPKEEEVELKCSKHKDATVAVNMAEGCCLSGQWRTQRKMHFSHTNN